MGLSALWRRLDGPGHDAARLEERADLRILTGAAVFLSDRGPAHLAYRVELAPDWTTISAMVRGFLGPATIDMAIRRGATGWTVNEEPQPVAASLPDIDFGFTPATNLQQLRRLNLEVGDEAELTAAWLDAGASTLAELPQLYRRVDRSRYEYEAPSVPYRETLIVAESGFVRLYPGLWALEGETA